MLNEVHTQHETQRIIPEVVAMVQPIYVQQVSIKVTRTAKHKWVAGQHLDYQQISSRFA